MRSFPAPGATPVTACVRDLGLASNRNHPLLLALAFNLRKAVRLAGAS